MASLAAEGATALASSDYPKAIKFYTEALAENPKAADYYIQRSTAYQRSSQPDLALKDAEIALKLANVRQKRELIVSSQFRRAVALSGLKRWHDAYFIFNIVKRLDAKFKGLEMWILRVESSLKTAEKEDVLIKEQSEVSLEAIERGDFVGIPLKSQPAKKVEIPKKEVVQPVGGASKPQVVATAVPAGPPKLGVSSVTDKIREDWYQTSASVNLSLLIKNVPKEETTISLKPNEINIEFPLESKDKYAYSFEPYEAIDAEKSTYRITPIKIELTLVKGGQRTAKWPSLKADTQKAISDTGSVHQSKPSTDKPPAYPTSSKSGPKDWEKIKPTAEEEEAEGDPVHNFFQKIYGNADEDTKRAMIKSYQESNGTALNTNWESVKNETVKTTPPEGMEAKQWGKE